MPNATLVHASPKHVLQLTPGDVTPAVLVDWLSACSFFFEERDVPEEKQVAKILSGLQDPLVRDWITSDSTRIRALAWSDFVNELKAQVLSEHWAQEVHNQLRRTKMKDNETFRAFSIQIEKLNVILRDTTEYLDHAALRKHFEVATCDDLASQISVNRGTLSVIKKYVDWKNAVISLDNKRVADNERIARLVRSSGRAATHTPNVGVGVGTNAGPTRANANQRPSLPQLTDGERKLLRDNDGCFKCRKFFVGHTAKLCPIREAPAAEGYRTLTQADADRARPASSSVAAVVDAPENMVAAVRAESPIAGILGNGSDSSDNDVRSPISSPHITWSALIVNADNPTLARAIPMLIDTGSPTVLIRASVADGHNLRRRRLPTPYRMGNAWNSEVVEATDWVKLRLSSPCASWFSRSVRAIVVPRLCAPVILGLPFLQSNNLVLDACGPSILHKPSGLDILHLPTPLPAPIPDRRSPLERRAASRSILLVTDPDNRALMKPLSLFRSLRARRLDRKLDLAHRLTFPSFDLDTLTAQPSIEKPCPTVGDAPSKLIPGGGEGERSKSQKKSPLPSVVSSPTRSINIDNPPPYIPHTIPQPPTTNPTPNSPPTQTALPSSKFIPSPDRPLRPTVEDCEDDDDIYLIPDHRKLSISEPILADIDDPLDDISSSTTPDPSDPDPSLDGKKDDKDPTDELDLDDTVDLDDPLTAAIAAVRERIEELQ